MFLGPVDPLWKASPGASVMDGLEGFISGSFPQPFTSSHIMGLYQASISPEDSPIELAHYQTVALSRNKQGWNFSLFRKNVSRKRRIHCTQHEQGFHWETHSNTQCSARLEKWSSSPNVAMMCVAPGFRQVFFFLQGQRYSSAHQFFVSPHVRH